MIGGVVAASGRRRSAIILPPSYVDATFTTVTSGTTTVAAVVPSGSGKLYAFCEANASTTTWACSHSGVITPTVIDGNSPIDDLTRASRFFEHPGDGSEGTPGSTITFTRSGTTTGIAGVLLVRIANAGTVQSCRFVSSNSSVVTITGRTSVAADTLFLQFVAMTATTSTTWGEPVGTTEHYDGASPGVIHAAVGSDVIGVGASGDRAWTRSSGSGTNRAGGLLINAA
jgi:hypothetical protein